MGLFLYGRDLGIERVKVEVAAANLHRKQVSWITNVALNM